MRARRAALCLAVTLAASAGSAPACDAPSHGALDGEGETRLAGDQPFARGTIFAAVFRELTARYPHAVLGDDLEWEALGAYRTSGPGDCAALVMHSLDRDHVFEDLAPRLYDLDGDLEHEVVVVRSHRDKGAQLAIYGLNADRTGLELITATPYIGTRFRWLAPLGAADLDGDGRVELAYIDRPHLAKTLRVWRYEDRQLTEVAALQGLTNHKIGEAFISGGIRDCGAGPEIISADAAWRQIVATRLLDGALEARAVAPFTGPSSFQPVLDCQE